MKTNEEIKKEWRKEWGDFLIDRLYEYSFTEGHDLPMQEAKYQEEQICNFWLQKMANREKEIVKEVERLKCIVPREPKGKELSYNLIEGMLKYAGRFNYNKALEDVLKIITNKK